MRQNTLLLTSLVDHPTATETSSTETIYDRLGGVRWVRNDGLVEMAKGRWNREVETRVRWVNEGGLEDVRRGVFGILGEGWRRIVGGGDNDGNGST